MSTFSVFHILHSVADDLELRLSLSSTLTPLRSVGAKLLHLVDAPPGAELQGHGSTPPNLPSAPPAVQAAGRGSSTELHFVAARPLRTHKQRNTSWTHVCKHTQHVHSSSQVHGSSFRGSILKGNMTECCFVSFKKDF